MEYLNDEDIDFIVDDGYKHDEDPDYDPEEEESSDEDDKYVVRGQDFKKLTKKAKKLGAESLDYSKRKNNKYVVTLPSGKKLHFGSSKYPDFLIHKDEEKKEKYLTRAKKIKNKKGELTYENPESANYWSVNLLWDKLKIFFLSQKNKIELKEKNVYNKEMSTDLQNLSIEELKKDKKRK